MSPENGANAVPGESPAPIAPQVLRVPLGQLSVRRFLDEFVAANRPVVVTGALESWDIANNWTPQALESRLGDRTVQVYNNYFDLQRLMPLRQFFVNHFGAPEGAPADSLPYVRWYTKLRDVRFFWADEAFTQLRGCWQLPAFMPDVDYLLPYAPPERRADPVTDHFPAKGLFISPRGARTSLHVDPWGSCAVLCQLYGQKRWYFYAPDQAAYLQNAAGVVDVTRPDRAKFPDFDRARLTATCILAPGEAVYVPHGWFHQVESTSDSVSLTWNFVHATTAASMSAWLAGPVSDFDCSVLRFFFRLRPEDDVIGRVSALVAERIAARQPA